jgi:hypothetical protein
MKQIRVILILTLAAGGFWGCTHKYTEDRGGERPSLKPIISESFSYQHKTIIADPINITGEKLRIAVKRFGDTKIIESSPFCKENMTEIAIYDIETDKIRKVEVSSLAIEVEPALFTEKVVQAMVDSGAFTVIERADIEGILREVKFESSEGEINKKSLVDVDLIITGKYGLNDRLIEWYEREGKRLTLMVFDEPNGRVPPQEALDEVKKMIKTRPPFRVVFLRAYEVKTGKIVGAASAEGDSDSELINKALGKLIKQIYQ